MSDWNSIKNSTPDNNSIVYSKSEDGRIFKSYFSDARNGGGINFGLCGYVWDHSNVIEWKPYDGTEVVSGYQE